MNMASLLDNVPSIIRIASFLPTLNRVISRGFSINAIEADIDDPDVRSFLRGIAAKFFPSVREELQVAAGSASTSPDYVMKVQKLINQVMPPTPLLDVDGDYGPLTREAVLVYQQARGLVPDEFAGDATMAALTTDALNIAPVALGGAS